MSPQGKGSPEIAASIVAAKTALARIYTNWSVRGPSLEASTAVTAMAQEEAGHARVLKRLTKDADGNPLTCLDRNPESWPQMIGTVGAVEVAMGRIIRALSRSRNEEWRGRAVKMAMEERFHEDFFSGWSASLSRESEGARRVYEEARIEADREVTGWLENLDALAADAGILAEGELLRGRPLQRTHEL